MRTIQYGDADMIVAGGGEMATTPLRRSAASVRRKALSTRNDESGKASRPWDKDRDGFVLSDGGGCRAARGARARAARAARASMPSWSASA